MVNDSAADDPGPGEPTRAPRGAGGGSAGAKVSNPIFARVFARLVALDDRSGQTEHRAELLAGLSGRVVEVGAGSGANFGHYPDGVDRVVAVEPEPYLRGLAVVAATELGRGSGPAVEVHDAVADELPVEDQSAVAVVASLVLCSLPDPLRALSEMARVVRPGGELRFYEHVRSLDEGSARWQERLDVLWPRLFGNCHTSRDTAATITEAGWEVTEIRRLHIGPPKLPNPVAPHIIGRAVRA